MDHSYEPLADPGKDIRVALLQPGHYDDEIRIIFRTQLLADSALPFEALSYVWGEKQNTSKVHVSDQGTLSIGENLDILLRHLRSATEERALWVDAVCINQRDMHERNKHVALMGKLYYLASRTIVWLGPEAEDSSKALDLLKYMASQVVINWREGSFRASEQCDDPSFADQSVLLPFVHGELNSICKLLERPYFERTWVRQEVTLSKRPIVHCGNKQIEWKDFVTGIGCLHHKRRQSESQDPSLETRLKRASTMAFDLCMLSTTQCDYNNLRFIFGHTKCKDPIDRIYAVLRLLPESDRQLGITPDYSLTPDELYMKITRRAIIERNRLNMLQACEFETKSDNNPTWVPNWSRDMRTFRAHPSTTWSACAWITSEATLLDDKTLSVSGIEAGVIKEVVPVGLDAYNCEYPDVLMKLVALGESSPVTADLDEFGSACLERYCRALLGDQFRDSFVPPNPNKPDLAMCIRFLNGYWRWAEDPSPLQNDPEVQRNFILFLTYCHQNFGGRSLFKASNGYIGLVPSQARPGDVIAVLLGCKYPMVLRPSSDSKAWEVIGVCNTEGLMRGELIYPGGLPNNAVPVVPEAKSEYVIEGNYAALCDSEGGRLQLDPAKTLTESGIKVAKYQRSPHVLEVLPEDLRAVGVPLREFSLV